MSALLRVADSTRTSWEVRKVPILLQKSLRQAAKRDSVALTRIAARSIHDGPSEE
jgi:hypothetical protein